MPRNAKTAEMLLRKEITLELIISNICAAFESRRTV